MKTNTILLISGIILLILIMVAKPVNKALKLTRGLRNNNPGNIRLTKSFWKGEIKGTDKDFKTFSSMAYGYRALFALLREYIHNGYNTINEIINRYAPGSENNTQAYINTVVRKTGLNPDQVLSYNDILKVKDIVKAISYVENGTEADPLEVEKGLKLVDKT